MSEASKWWEIRTPRSVDNLRLWIDNPRLDPIENHETLNDFVEDLLSDNSERDEFIALVKSIAERGFQSFDPVVVWKDDKGRFVVAEGNRRVLALKLLRKPESAPQSISRFIREQSRLIDRDSIEKIKVCVAPSYEETRWYILQRHSTGSLLKKWQRLQQQRFILNAYEEQNEDIDATASATGMKPGEINEALRFVCIRNIATRNEITSKLSLEEREQVYSHKISMTILERWFSRKLIREKWGLDFQDMTVVIKSELNSFYSAYAQFLKIMLNPSDNILGFPINTRTIDQRFDEIFNVLPLVKFPSDGSSVIVTPEKFDADKEREGMKTPAEEGSSESAQPSDGQATSDGDAEKQGKSAIIKRLTANPDRNQMASSFYSINVTSYKLKALFNELQVLPVKRYKNVSASSLRVFLDLSVDEYIKVKGLESDIAAREKCAYPEVSLIKRLRFIQSDHIQDREAKKVVAELLTHSNDHSLNTLNDYVHGTKTHKTNHRFINGFWDMLTPLLAELIDLKEK
ncbi:ParB N-terminal domain-containing protein [Shewanella sp. YIC-542]|uniref:ParB N-terminal domain-containing protein n=1 Tax=Shewanella mytili TaxID=3377111 RepID=UPI00398F38F3